MNKFHKAPNKAIETSMVQKIYRAEDRLKGTLKSPYQPAGVRFMILKELTGPGCILADDMGLGKTVMTVAFILGMHEPGQAPTLVVAPKSVCPQWKDEVTKFSDLRCEVYDRGDVSSDVDVLVISYSFFMRESCLNTGIFLKKFHRIILDEAHFVKNFNTVTSKHIRELQAPKRLCLSGTPIQNDPKDLFSLVRWIYQEEPQLIGKLNMSSRCKASRMQCIEFIRNNMIMRRTLDDVSKFNESLTLPSLDVKVVSIPFTNQEELSLYQHVEEIAKERIKNVLKQYNTQGNMDILEALLRCRQVCIHPRLFLDAAREQDGVHHKWKVPARYLASGYNSSSTKLETLVNMIQSHPADKTLVFSTFVKEMRCIRAMLRDAGIQSLLYHGDMSGPERESVLNRFKTPDDKHMVLIIQMNAGGTGLNLQIANRCYMTSPAYNPSLELQCIARAHRTGQTKDVTCIRLVMQDTVEEKILDIQKKKLIMISEALNDERISEKLNKNQMQLTKDDICALFNLSSSSSSESEDDEDDDNNNNTLSTEDSIVSPDHHEKNSKGKRRKVLVTVGDVDEDVDVSASKKIKSERASSRVDPKKQKSITSTKFTRAFDDKDAPLVPARVPMKQFKSIVDDLDAFDDLA